MCRKEVTLISHHKYSKNCLENEVCDHVQVLSENSVTSTGTGAWQQPLGLGEKGVSHQFMLKLKIFYLALHGCGVRV